MVANSQIVHIALIGTVSVGKSTLLNAILTARVAPMAMIRSTAGETIYTESKDAKEASDLYDTFKAADEKLMKKSMTQGNVLKTGDVYKTHVEIPLINDLVDDIHERGALLAINDLPGLNDGPTKACYHAYIAQRFEEYDVVLFVVDIHSGMNTSDEKDVLALISNGIKLRKTLYGAETKLIVIINKCDEMIPFHVNTIEMRPADAERQSMFDQVVKLTGSTKYRRTVLCLSAEDAYVLRMFHFNPKCVIDENHRNKFGINEFGKTKWLSMNKDAQDLAISKHFKKNYDTGMKISGWKWFAHVLSENINSTFLLNCTITQIKREVMAYFSKFVTDHLAVTTGRFNVLIGGVLSSENEVNAIHRFLSIVAKPLYDKYQGLVISGVQKNEYNTWFRGELTAVVNQVALPIKLRGQNGITSISSFKQTQDVKRIYVYLRDELSDWANADVENTRIAAINSESLNYLYKELFNPALILSGIITILDTIKSIDQNALIVNPSEYIMSIPYRVCAKLCDYEAFDIESKQNDIVLSVVEAVGEILLKCGTTNWMTFIIILRAIIPRFERYKELGTNCPRIVATFDLFFINVAKADPFVQELVDYAIQIKARALDECIYFTTPGKNTYIAELVMIVLKNLANAYPDVFIDLRSKLTCGAPPVYENK